MSTIKLRRVSLNVPVKYASAMDKTCTDADGVLSYTEGDNFVLAEPFKSPKILIPLANVTSMEPVDTAADALKKAAKDEAAAKEKARIEAEVRARATPARDDTVVLRSSKK